MTFDPTKTARLLAMFDSGLAFGALADWAEQLRGALAMVPVVEAAERWFDNGTVGVDIARAIYAYRASKAP